MPDRLLVEFLARQNASLIVAASSLFAEFYLSGGHSKLDHRGDLLGMQSLWPAQRPALRHHQEGL